VLNHLLYVVHPPSLGDSRLNDTFPPGMRQREE